MASTNKTTHFNLSQYIGTDKPTYLGDYNADMLAIDTALYGIKTTADTCATNLGDLTNLNTTNKTNIVNALNEVNSLATGIGLLTNLNTTDKSSIVNALNEVNNKANTIGTLTNLSTTEKSSIVGSINEVNGKIGNLSSLNTTNKANAVASINELKGNIDNFNLTSYDDLTDITATGFNISSNTIKIAKNSDGSLAKIYGNIAVTSTQTNGNKIVISGSGLTPSSDITINNAGIIRINNSQYSPTTIDITIKTNGNIEINKDFDNGQVILIMLFPMLYFIKDFGDTPINQM